MDKATYLRAVKTAKRIFVYTQITANRRQAIRISKAKAAALVSQVADTDDIDAMWADDEQRSLLVG